MDGGGAGEGGKDPKAPPVLLDWEVESAAEARTLIDDVQLQLSRLGRWVDLVRARGERASDPGIDVRRPPGPEPPMHSPVPTTPTAAPRVLTRLFNYAPATAGDTAGKPNDQEGEQCMPDDAKLAGSESNWKERVSRRWKPCKRLRTQESSSTVDAESLDADRNGPRKEDNAADERSPEFIDPFLCDTQRCSSERAWPEDSNLRPA